MPTPLQLNQAQMIVIEDYAVGDFAHFNDFKTKEEFDSELENCGDTLFKFLMIELSESEDCSDIETSINRMNTVAESIRSIQSKLENFESNKDPEVAFRP